MALRRTTHARPLIGVTCGMETITDRRGAPQSRYVTQRNYADAVARGGGLPVMLPFYQAANTSPLLDHLAGVVISGGDFDVPPEYYGQEPRPGLGRLLPERSGFERALLNLALRRDIPVLGICGGMQLLNVLCGGTLYQDGAERAHTQEHEQPHDRRVPHHAVELRPGTLVSQVWDTLQVQTNSTHHQLIDKVGRGLIAAGVAPDGVVEAIEHRHKRFCVGVQWHPEALSPSHHGPLFTALVKAAAAASDQEDGP